MNLKKWKLGLLVSSIIGFFTACAAAAMLDGLVINWKFFLFFLGLIGKDVILYLKDHPVDTISDTAFVERPEPSKLTSNPVNSGHALFEWIAFVAVISLVAIIFLCSGCASFTTTQKDISYYENGKPQRSITTQAKAKTLAEAKSNLASFRASQTDKTQGASVGSLSQEANSTNAVQVLNALKGIVESLPK